MNSIHLNVKLLFLWCVLKMFKLNMILGCAWGGMRIDPTGLHLLFVRVQWGLTDMLVSVIFDWKSRDMKCHHNKTLWCRRDEQVINPLLRMSWPTCISHLPLQLKNWTVCWLRRTPWLGSWRRSVACWEPSWKSWAKTAGNASLCCSSLWALF